MFLAFSIRLSVTLSVCLPVGLLNPLTSRPGCIPGSRYTGVGVLFFVI